MVGSHLDRIPLLQAWHRVPLGHHDIFVHPATGWVSAVNGGWAVAILGLPIDLDDGEIDAGVIAERLLARLALGLDEGVRYAAYLGGRSVSLMSQGSELTILPDCTASMSAFWHATGDHFVAGSHSHLVGDIVGAEPDPRGKDLMATARAMATKGTLYLPGLITPFVGVKPLMANHLLSWDGHVARHQRFYPFSDTTLDRDPDTAAEVFDDLFSRHVAAMCRFGRVGISLTAGMDSRTTIAAALPHLGGDVLTWTYYNFGSPHKGMQDDLLAANALARSLGLPHQIVAIEEGAGSDFGPAYLTTMKHGAQFRALAQAYYDQLPADIVELQSMVSEVGTGFYKNRSDTPTPERLSYLYSATDFGRRPDVVEAITDFIDYADFRPELFGPVDYHDLFYWETRIGRWGALRMQEVDLAHQLMLPFNSRGIVEALQGPPLADRRAKQALQRYIDRRQVG